MNAIVEKIQLLKLPFMMDTPTKELVTASLKQSCNNVNIDPSFSWWALLYWQKFREEICTFVRTASFPHIDDYRKNHDEVEQIKWDAFFTKMGWATDLGLWSCGPGRSLVFIKGHHCDITRK